MASLTAESLLETAQRLMPSGRGRPREADLRRAVSTAYYAVFCALCEEAAQPYEGDLNLMIKRLVAHASARDVLARLTVMDRETRQQRLRWLPDQPVCDPDLLEFSELYCRLLGNREEADYDHMHSQSKSDTRLAISKAERAVQLLRSARLQAPDQVQAVCIAAIASPSARNRISWQ